MIISLIVATLIIVLCSFKIATNSGKSLNRRGDSLQSEFLFEGNNTIKSIFSNIGTYITLTTYVCGMFFSGYKYGYSLLISILVGLLMTFLILFICKSLPYLDEDGLPYYTLSWFIYKRIGGNAFFMYIITLFVFFICLIVSELTILSYFFKVLINHNTSIYFVPIIFIAVLCVEYVWIGGFRGILNTDIYQVVVVIICLALTTFLAFSGAWNVSQLGSVLSNGGKLQIYTTTTNIDAIATHVPLSFCMFALFLCTTEIWTKSVGTLKPTERFPSILFTILFIIIFTAPLLLMGVWLRGSFHEISNPFLVVSKIILLIVQYNSLFAVIVFMGLISIAITTVDSALLMIFQNIKMIERRFIIKISKNHKDNYNDKENVFERKKYSHHYFFYKLYLVRYLIIALTLSVTYFLNFYYVYLFLQFTFVALSSLLIIILSAVLDFYLSEHRVKIKKHYRIICILSRLFLWKNFSWIPVIFSILFGYLFFNNLPESYICNISKKWVHIVVFSFSFYILLNSLGHLTDYLLKKIFERGTESETN